MLQMPSNKQKSLPHLSLCLGQLISHQNLLIQIAVVISLHIPSAWLFLRDSGPFQFLVMCQALMIYGNIAIDFKAKSSQPCS